MAYQTWMLEAAKDYGLSVVEVPGWRTRSSDGHGRYFEPRGVIAHHTATKYRPFQDYPSLRIVRDGRSDLPGPLSQWGLGYSGTAYLIAAGKANHAGAGQWDLRPNGPLIDHSNEVIGIEAEHPGRSGYPWPDVQLDAYYRLCAALLDGMGVSTRHLCGHKEWAQPPESTANRKIDPYGLGMNQFRLEVENRRTDVAQFTSEEAKALRGFVEAMDAVGTNGGFVKAIVPWFRKLSGLTPEKIAELEESDELAELEAKIDQLVVADYPPQVVDPAEVRRIIRDALND